MSASIPIANIYYLLCYAWNRLEQGKLIDISQTPTTELADLFALVLCDGIRHLAQRGLEQGYEIREEELSGIRGRLDIASSLRRTLFMQGRAHCRYDELTADTSANRILKATLVSLQKADPLDRKLYHKIRVTVRSLPEIRDIRLSRKAFDSVRVTSNNLFYRFLLGTCRLVFDSLLVDETSGKVRFRDFTRDEDKMAGLFQSFLFNFIARECLEWTVKSENINWRAVSPTDPNLLLLPRMQTDISAMRSGEYRIIDAKYYRRTLSSYFDIDKLHSGNLYQMSSYLLNAKTIGGIQADGMLIYPKVDRDLREKYEILGRNISVSTVDLNAPWQSIAQELRALMA